MSLNGLDEPKVVEAHEAAAAEPGGWFLLKYASRDEVELLDRGNGGIVEVRNTISAYDEESPLYGFLRYRRRNVVIKYLPEDCSRLIQARVAVHFNAICERFSPYDTIFEISTATELRDTKLSAACSLHAASGSTSSSTSSLRRRRLMEIAEEDEEEQRALKRQSIVPEAEGERPKTPADKTSLADPVTLNSDLASSPEASKFSATTTSEVLNFVGAGDGPTSPARSIDPDTYSNYSLYPTGKPRVKLGPRPSASVDATIRPQTAGNFRPVSSIPAGFKLFGKGAKKGKTKDANPATSPQEEIPEPVFPNVATATEEDANDSSSSRPGSRTGVTSPVPVPATTPTKPTISPEKARLMKAMQLREKRKKMAAAKAAQNVDAPVDEEKTVVENTREKAHEKEDDDIDDIIEEEPEEDEADDDAKDDVDESQPSTETADEKKRLSLVPADSGVVLDSLESSVHTDEASELTQTESRAESPGVASVEADQSTMASSLSESTEETVQAKDDTREAETDEKDDAVPPTEMAEAEPKQEKENDTLAAEAQDLQEVETDAVVIPTEEPAEESTEKPIEELIEQSVGGPVAESVVEPITASEPTKVEVEEKDATETKDDSEQLVTKAAPTSSEIPEAQTEKDEPSPVEQVDAVEPIEKEEAPKLMVPKSKFSTQDLAAASKDGSPSHSTVGTPKLEPESSPLEQEAQALQESKEQAKRPIPIKTDIAQKSLDDSIGADDSDLADDSALIEEAKPVPFSKSPLTSSFPPSAIRAVATSDNIRTVSNPVRGNLAVPSETSQASVRSLSSGAAFLNRVHQHQQSSSPVVTKPIVGSSISQRIKALEKLSAGSADQARPASRERPSSTFFSVQKRETTSRSPSVADRAKSLKGPPSPEQSFNASLEMSRGGRKRSPSTASRFSKFEVPASTPLATAGQSRGRPESISVTAKIIRDPQPQEPKDVPEYNYLNLKQSPLVVDHHAVESDSSERRSGSLERDAKDAKRSSMSIVKGFIREHRKSVTTSADVQQALASAVSTSRPSSSTQNNVASHRLSISSRRSSISKDRDNAFLPSSNAVDEEKSGDKVMSRAGRFMRRLSNFSGARGKGSVNLASPVAEEGPSIDSKRSTTATSSGSPSIISDMGDVNVQFPDNLLWKRRNLCLDSQGFLILSASSQNGKPAVGTKRYHLSEFRQPYTPDVEVQELPNSVVLDFVEGAGIQLACEDRAGQLNVLKVLRDAHTGHSTFGR